MPIYMWRNVLQSNDSTAKEVAAPLAGLPRKYFRFAAASWMRAWKKFPCSLLCPTACQSPSKIS